MSYFAWRAAPLLALTVLVTGCITSAEQTAKRNEERCVARGHQPKTDAFNDCLVQLDSERTQRMESNRRDMMERPASPGMPRGY